MMKQTRDRCLRSKSAKLLAVLVVMSSFPVFLGTSWAQSSNNQQAEDLVLAVATDKTRLSAGIFAVEKDSKYYLPVSQLADVLGFNATVNVERGLVEGWTISDNETFLIDRTQGKLQLGSKSTSVSPEAFLDESIASDDVYILMEVLNQIWPVQLNVNVSSLVLRVLPDDKLPFELLIERKQRQKKLAAKQELEVLEIKEDLPFLAYPYQLVGKPVIDVDVVAGYDAQIDGLDSRLSLNGVQDLGYASADYSLTLSERDGVFREPENLRLRFRRQNIHEGALPFGLEDTQWGDVRLPNRKLISNGAGGRGLVFTTQRNNYENEFDTITIDGVGSPGWEVELYINDQLIEFTNVDETGEYRFDDVSIGYGNNRVKTVLYGPQGQVREKEENYFYQSNMVKKGDNLFSGGLVQENIDLIPIDERSTKNQVEGLAANLYAARGISDKLTAFASVSTLQDRDGNNDVTRQYLTAGAIGSFATTLLQGEVYKEIDGGQALDIRTLSDFYGFKVNSQAAFYQDFESPDALNNDRAKTMELDINVRKVLPTGIGSLGLEAGAEYLEREDGLTRMVGTTRQSLGVRGTRLSNQTRSTFTDGDHSTSTGRISGTTRLNDLRLRNSLNYLVHPEPKVSSIQTELRYGNYNRKSENMSTAIRAQRNFDSQETILGFQITRDFEKFLGSVEADWSSRFGSSIFLRASTSIGPYDADGSYVLNSQSMRNTGPVSALVYLDKDYDGFYSEGDEVVPNTKISLGRRLTQSETDEDGYLVEIRSSANNVVDVSVASESIDDPYLVASTGGFSMYPRPGAMHSVELPLIETGAIDGSLSWTSGKPIAGLIIELMNDNGDVVKKSKTAPDGYYTFERIKPGSYTIRAAPETGYNIPFKYVDLTPDNMFQFGMDIQATDLSDTADVDLDFGMADEGVMKVKNILSIAKGFKSTKTKVAPANEKSLMKKASFTEPQKNARAVNAIAPKAGGNSSATSVQDIRVGEHPNKVRVVMDLSGQTKYKVDYDAGSKSVFIDLPTASWATDTSLNKNSKILNGFKIEPLDQGTRLVLAIKDGARVGASGLLNASGSKKDRLYIDIERK